MAKMNAMRSLLMATAVFAVPLVLATELSAAQPGNIIEEPAPTVQELQPVNSGTAVAEATSSTEGCTAGTSDLVPEANAVSPWVCGSCSPDQQCQNVSVGAACWNSSTGWTTCQPTRGLSCSGSSTFECWCTGWIE